MMPLASGAMVGVCIFFKFWDVVLVEKGAR